MADELRPYPEYKQSKLRWLGRIPSHWSEKRAKYFFREVDERSTTGKEELLSVSHVTGVTPRSQKNITMFMAESYAGHKLCRPGDLVINTMWAWMAALGVAKNTGIVSPSYGVYRPLDGEELLSEYADALLRTESYRSEYVCRSTGIRGSRLRLYPDKFLDISIVCPPVSEQRQMVAFLNSKDGAVRRFIRNKRRLIALLNEQKQVTVFQAVARGLDATARLKFSGIKWLEATPEHWTVAALRLRYSVELGKMLDEKRITGQHLVPYLRNIDVQWDRINIDDLPVMDISPREYARYTLKNGDMLVCEGGDVGRSAFWNGQLPLCGYQKALHRVRPLDGTRDNARFLYYVMYAASKRGVFLADGSENTIAHLTCEKLRWHRFAFPPKCEQDAICVRLQEGLRILDRSIEHAQHEIELIREYQARLITDVVTGKLDVRHLSVTTGQPSPVLDAMSETDELLADESPDELEAAEEVAIGDE